MTAKEIADQPAFPATLQPGGNVTFSGMTYRQWLVGRLASGLCSNPEFTPRFDEEIVTWASTQADLIINALAKEHTNES